MSHVFVVVTGLAGVGKSTLARALAREVGLVLLELDRMEASLLNQGISGDDLGWGGYEAITALAEDNLRLGLGVVLDSVGWTQALRTRWAELAEASGAAYRPIELTCSDLAVHWRRLESRDSSGRSRRSNPDWEAVQARRTLYEPWDRSRLVLDSVRPPDDLVREAASYVRGGAP